MALWLPILFLIPALSQVQLGTNSVAKPVRLKLCKTATDLAIAAIPLDDENIWMVLAEIFRGDNHYLAYNRAHSPTPLADDAFEFAFQPAGTAAGTSYSSGSKG